MAFLPHGIVIHSYAFDTLFDLAYTGPRSSSPKSFSPGGIQADDVRISRPLGRNVGASGPQQTKLLVRPGVQAVFLLDGIDKRLILTIIVLEQFAIGTYRIVGACLQARGRPL